MGCRKSRNKKEKNQNGLITASDERNERVSDNEDSDLENYY